MWLIPSPHHPPCGLWDVCDVLLASPELRDENARHILILLCNSTSTTILLYSYCYLVHDVLLQYYYTTLLQYITSKGSKQHDATIGQILMVIWPLLI